MPLLEKHCSLQDLTLTGEFLIYCQLMGSKDIQINTPNPRGALTGAWMTLTEGIKKSAGAECQELMSHSILQPTLRQGGCYWNACKV